MLSLGVVERNVLPLEEAVQDHFVLALGGGEEPVHVHVQVAGRQLIQ